LGGNRTDFLALFVQLIQFFKTRIELNHQQEKDEDARKYCDTPEVNLNIWHGLILIAFSLVGKKMTLCGTICARRT
jgi:hypothetical protein